MEQAQAQVQVVKPDSQVVTIETDKGELKLSPAIVRKYLVNGNGKVNDQEVMMFLSLCKFQRLNPFLREVYLIKYGDDSPATMVTGKETFLKRAVKNPRYAGHKVGILEDGKVAWAEVYIKGYDVPIRCEVNYCEYVGLKDEWVAGKRTGNKVPNRQWAEKPRTMLKKVALVQALREAFPEDFGGLYSQEEINRISDPLPENEVKAPEVSEPRSMHENDSQVPDSAPISAQAAKSEAKREYDELIELKNRASKKVQEAIIAVMEEYCTKVNKATEEFTEANYLAVIPGIRNALK